MRITALAVLFIGTALMTGCASKQVITASSTYRDGASDAISALDSAIAAHIDVSRQRQILGWQDAPVKILPAGVLKQTFDSQEALAAWVCEPSGEASVFALGLVSDYGQNLAVVSKAPGDGLVPTLNAIGRHQERINELRKRKPERTASHYEDRLNACRNRVADLFSSAFDIPLPAFPQAPIPHFAPRKTDATIMTGTAALDAIFAAYEAMKATASLIERETRAEVIRAYVAANESRVKEGLAALTGDVAKVPEGMAMGVDLKKSIDDRLRFYLTTTVLGAAEARSEASMAVRRSAAEAVSRNVSQYRALADMDIRADVIDPLLNAHRKFVASVENPEASFDDFMEAMAELRDNRGKWIDARDKYRSWAD